MRVDAKSRPTLIDRDRGGHGRGRRWTRALDVVVRYHMILAALHSARAAAVLLRERRTGAVLLIFVDFVLIQRNLINNVHLGIWNINFRLKV